MHSFKKKIKLALLDWGPGSDNLSQKSLNQPLLMTLPTK